MLDCIRRCRQIAMPALIVAGVILLIAVAVGYYLIRTAHRDPDR